MTQSAISHAEMEALYLQLQELSLEHDGAGGRRLINISHKQAITDLAQRDSEWLHTFFHFLLKKVEQQRLLPEESRFYEGTLIRLWMITYRIAAGMIKMMPNPDEPTFVYYTRQLADVPAVCLTYHEWPYDTLVDMATPLVKANGLTQPLEQALRLLRETPEDYHIDILKKTFERIDFLLQGDMDSPFAANDPWGEVLVTFFKSLPPGESAAWQALLRHCASQADKNAPAQQWSKITPALLEAVGHDRFSHSLQSWLQVVQDLLREAHQHNERFDFLTDINHELLRPLIWCAGFVNDPLLNNTLDEYAAWAYKKKPNVGPLSAKTGTACMYAFSLLPVKEGVSRLTKFRMKIQNKTVLKGIDKIISDVSKKQGVGKDELEEMAVPDLGLDEQGLLRMAFGDYQAVYTVNRLNDAALHWEKEGNAQKSLPAAVKTGYAAELKVLKAQIKEIESLLPVYKDKLEQTYLQQKSWDYEQWEAGYLRHPLMGILGRKLIWHFESEGVQQQGIWWAGKLVDVQGNPLAGLSGTTQVHLWHPIGFEPKVVVAWREFLLQHEITQPFKQAYREVYLLTEAELRTDTYSNRFAAHVLRQQQFAALCRQRNWHYSVMGNWDSHNTPGVSIPAWNMMAQYYVDANWQGDLTDTGIYQHILTDQVRFYRDREQLRLQDVPAMVFTEIMRDVDLFVGVSSIGNDPSWRDNGNALMNTYWGNYSFGELSESAHVRVEVLKKLVPRLKISNQCSFEGKFLIVEGKLRTYKIHMGSGNILMTPNDQYLCIVPEYSADKNKERVFLPFEGDNLLSIIISKALLLADDNKIKDETITRQITPA